MADIGPEVTVRRPVYQLNELQRVCDYTKPRTPIGKAVSKKCRSFSLGDFLRRTIPLTNWLPKYGWRREISGDLVAGVTVAVMHIPQGMAYAILGNVSPVIGIYMAFFPVLVYLFLGTSKHNSMGSFALVCLMTGKIVARHSSPGPTAGNATAVDLSFPEGSGCYSSTEVATAITFTVAVIQLSMHFCRLGVISTLLSDTLVSGFTTAAAIHVLTSQIKDLLGLKLPSRTGIFKIVMTYVDIFSYIENLNITATILSAVTIILLTFNNEVLKVLLAKKCTIPIPIEMIAVLAGTILSTQLNLADGYGVTTVGNIPVGLPPPTLPPLELVPIVLVDSFVITMVSYTISMSMALIFAQRNNYEVDANQELLAQGSGNLVGSFFSCMPFTASLSRSMIQETVGGRSQLASLVSCGLLLCVLLWVGPFFEPLPRCVLASIIVVALKGMLLQVRQFRKFWCLSRVDAAVWMTTFLTVVFLDIEYGLLAGMIVSLVSLLILSMRPYVCRMGLVPGTEIYLDVKRYRGTVELPGVKMLHYCGGLNFASRHLFRNEAYKIAGVVPQKELIKRSKIAAKETTKIEKTEQKGYVNGGFDEEHADGFSSTAPSILKVLILDLSALTYVDPAGVGTLRNIIDEFETIQVAVYITGCSGPVYETMRKCNTAERKEGHYFTMFPTIGDAVNFALHERSFTLTSARDSSLIQTHEIHPDEDECCSSRL
ncbi:prestin isoform X2 [Neodiprion pinetum]|nr:solute carrier family 26 member 10-like [Neodiprion pinetum]XP_046467424.1 solute carrier family 26 member 10-like [Neodiprion pinetum]XP_046467425.1 solute carrier family 26 member 10-like [Neodiprion pinetum]